MSLSLMTLQQNLQQVIEESSDSDRVLGKPEIMAITLQNLQTAFSLQASTAPPEDRILNAVNRFISTNSYSDEYQARLIAWGLVLPRGSALRMIELESFCSAFFTRLQNDFMGTTISLRVWRGLLSSYLLYPGMFSSNSEGKDNWLTLRALLRQSFKVVHDQRSFKPEWMVTLHANLNLLEDNPCAKYIDFSFDKDDHVLNRLKTSLLISENSWVMAEIVRAKVERACSQTDDLFKTELPTLCRLLRDHSLYANSGLIALLTRYCSSSDSKEHHDLAKLAVDLWGNPKLPLSHPWQQVSNDVKNMVLKWLISKDLRIFFDLFSKDHDADQDKRRLRFWLRYIDHIEDAFFVLGSHAASSRDADYAEMRHNNQGRISRLDQAGSPKNNAFIMLVAGYAIVEFGKGGNACFCFDVNNLPFQLESSWLRGDTTQLKNSQHPGCQFRLIHKDAPIKWETSFEDALGRLRIFPGHLQGKVDSRLSAKSSGTGPRDHDSRTTRRPEVQHGFHMRDLKDFVARFGLTVKDLRPKGGHIWIQPDSDSIAISRQLDRWGFRRKNGKGWWLPV